MEHRPIISLCIPTNGAIQWIKPTIENIYLQDCKQEDFEVIVVDNSISEKLREYIECLPYTNLRYVSSTVEGFSNQIFALKCGKGIYCKLYNHRLLLQKGILKRMIDFICRFQQEKPVLFFSQGNPKYKEEYFEMPDFESFMRKLSYWSSWSGGVGVWNSDIPQLDNIKYDKMFPCASLLFEIREQSKYVIWNVRFDIQQDDKGKGGYNFFETFAIRYLDIINELRRKERISVDTFNLIRRDLYAFLCSWYYKLMVKKGQYTFDTSDIDTSMSVYYSTWQYKKMVVYAHITPRWKRIMRIPSYIYRKIAK